MSKVVVKIIINIILVDIQQWLCFDDQVTLEEQMICGALQTLNEEACEDVCEVPSSKITPTDSLSGEPTTSIPLSLPLVIVQEPPQSDESSDITQETFYVNL